MVHPLKLLSTFSLFYISSSQEPLLQEACQAGDRCEAEASLALLQRGAYPHQARTAPAAKVLAAQAHRGHAASETSQAANTTEFVLDCSGELSSLCSELLQCDKKPVTAAEMARLLWRVSTPDGRANLRTWCLKDNWGFANNLVQSCLVEHDLKKSAQEVFDFQVGRGLGGYDGSYCFLEDHCNNEDVTPETTLEEAELVCDKRYPDWKKFGLRDFLSIKDTLDLVHTAISKPGTLGPTSSRLFATAACAMGNYHCDVVYCKQTFCKQDSYIQQFGHLTPKKK